MQLHSNHTAYVNVESMDNYKDEQDLDNYRKHLLIKSEPQRNFIRRLFNEKKINVFEACSGNSRLLYALAQAGLLNQGTGIELSLNRHIFAEKWKEALGHDHIVNVNDDVLDYRAPDSFFHLGLCITGAFGYFAPVDNGHPLKLLQKMNGLLVAGGKLILELYTHRATIELCRQNQGSIKMWKELEDGDPFRFILTDYTYAETDRILNCRETFVRRDGLIDDSKTEVLRIYDATEICGLLDKAGFGNISLFSDWNGAELMAGADVIIVVSEKIRKTRTDF
ncbi:MAG: hypothetical protein ACYC2T_04510 [Bacillota bacterium]